MHERQKDGRGFVSDLSRAIGALVALGTLYSLVVDVLNKVALLVTGRFRGMTAEQVSDAAPVAAPLIKVILPDPVAEVIIACIVVGVIVYYVLKWLCQEQWVQEPVQIKECWEEVKWYNPWSWVKAIVCTVKEVLKWVLKVICGWVWVAVIALVVICIVVVLIILLA